MDEFFRDFHQKAIDVLNNVEAAVNGMAPTKRRTTTVRAPFLQQVPIHNCDVEDAILGVWHYDNSQESFEICYDQQGKLKFKEGKRKGELAFCADGETLVASLIKQNGKAHGTIKLRFMTGGSAAPNRILSHFRPAGSAVWRKEIVSIKRRECSIDRESSTRSMPERPIGHPAAACSSQSRTMPEEGPEVRSCLHAKSAPPQELHFVAPLDCTPGQKICLLGPHGDPVTLPLPAGAEPGKPCRICLGPKSTFQVVVPEGASPGSTVVFDAADGVMLNTVVPSGKMPGDSFDIVPPVVIVQVPHLAKAGDDVTFTLPTGDPGIVEVPAGLSAGDYFAVRLPRLAGGNEPPWTPRPPRPQEETRQNQGASPSQLGPASTTESFPMESSLQKPMTSVCKKISYRTGPPRPMTPEHTEQKDSCHGMPQCCKPRADDPLNIDDEVFREFDFCRRSNDDEVFLPEVSPKGKVVPDRPIIKLIL